jgi:uncharacterized protein (DUF885 family)
MGELGYLDDPGLRLGQLDSQLMNAAVAVLDIGVHLDLKSRRAPAPACKLGARI